ncbi:MAG: FAD-dependent oxidoreductase [Clostridiales bacterium]|nr:FAD-dependent oxidoreductase [Clostridiales bacterium]
MSRLTIMTTSKAQTVVEELYRDMERRIVSSPPGLCPIDLTASFLKMCHAQTCGKCVPCRIGLAQLGNLLDDVLKGRATPETLQLIKRTAHVIKTSADCAIGVEAANMVLKGIDGYYDDYMEHINHKRCLCHINQPVPCVALCPAGVDIPGYVALVAEGRYADAVKLIRKDNPFPTACALICEHPCEARCRRNMVDAPVNIRGLKRIAVEKAGVVPAPKCEPSTGKRNANTAGGPTGGSAASDLQLMGHHATVFEQRPKLGGMLLYGIPNYRLPRVMLQRDIDTILSTGVEVRLNSKIGDGEGQISMNTLRDEYDAVYISIGAHTDKKIGLEGEDAEGVLSAVEMLGSIGDGIIPDFRGKRVCVIGGGNVAMDVTRSAIRCGASKVSVVYRRRIKDMTALPDEIQGAAEEGANIMELYAPSRIETDGHNRVTALWASPKMIGKIERGRPSPTSTGLEDERIPCEVIIVAIGQGIETRHFETMGIPIQRGVIKAADWAAVENAPGVFAGGDCVTGPATVIRAIAAGKVAAANIDSYLGYHHIISTDVEVPQPSLADRHPCGRVNMKERPAADRKCDFDLIECPMSDKEAHQEASRCLRCDHYGYGIFKGGRTTEW